MAFLCVDIGGTNTLLGIGNSSFDVEREVKSREFLDDMAAIFEETVRDSGHRLEDIEEVAIAAAGPIDREKGEFFPPNISDMDNVQLRKPLETLGDVKIVNDCTSAAVGEYYYGESSENMLYLTISSGIGMGAVIDGEVVEGWHGNLGEVGHMTISDRDIGCGCGGSGHWEALCSGENLPQMAEEVFGADYESAREVFDAYESGESEAEKVIQKMSKYNGEAVTDLVNVFNPEVVAIGGAVALNHPEVVVEPLREEVEKHSINGVPDIKTCELGDRSVIHGLRAVCNGKFK